MRWLASGLLLAALGASTAGCQFFRDNPYSEDYCAECLAEDEQQALEGNSETNKRRAARGEAVGLFNFSLSGASKNEGGGGGGSAISVNGYLWRASLDTLSFLPLATADPFGGVIISDWYVPPDAQDERFKVTVFILARRLRSDGIKAAVFKQDRDEERGWVDTEVDDTVATELEDAILTRAREMRVSES